MTGYAFCPRCGRHVRLIDDRLECHIDPDRYDVPCPCDTPVVEKQKQVRQ